MRRNPKGSIANPEAAPTSADNTISGMLGPAIATLAAVLLVTGDASPRGVGDIAVPDAVPRSATLDAQFLLASASAMAESTQLVWRRLFASMGADYVDPRWLFFRDAVDSACGPSQPAMGSFYCPIDRIVYVDLSSYQRQRERLGIRADLAQEYVMAHEIAHHVQSLRRHEQREGRVRAFQTGEAAKESTLLELQADCLAGVSWHFRTARAAAAGRSEMEDAQSALFSFGADASSAATHGSNARRVDAFDLGFEAGRVSACASGP